ncbi:hypothetical protein CONLIGDRAFT_685760 [Coniochaeta ligniaria NRRL 30616]|uniref:Uncharacterized protein n=1 Tax=Coniochaeta ligniaria NRRL 30616 TaxID=1408157 RepID=A0A1J7J2T3_9PEZI|nr:hypothetical protein CONLIGDRAFT_685760 [Coniochaeta ligniaria NRRL 30616]
MTHQFFTHCIGKGFTYAILFSATAFALSSFLIFAFGFSVPSWHPDKVQYRDQLGQNPSPTPVVLGLGVLIVCAMIPGGIRDRDSDPDPAVLFRPLPTLQLRPAVDRLLDTAVTAAVLVHAASA